ncbi:MAG TPA: BON domain-containing protein [Longimicrobium sp.]|nr:BON domain-containing protein [Longimicrobium sp.]
MSAALDLQHNVLEELRWEPSVRSTEVGVTATDDVVTLTGTVDSYAKKVAAERAAKRVHGVRGVANELEVRLPSEMRRTDTDIAEAAVRVLEWDVWVPRDRVQVTVRGGWVTLEGEVDWRYQAEQAARVVRQLTGVVGVTNLVRVRPRVKPEDVERKIEAALKRQAAIDADRVRVESVDGKVVLRGALRSWAELEDAERASWSAPGVTHLESHLEVETSPFSTAAA